MADVLVGSERRVLISGYGLPPAPPPESLLCRLDQIDLRLRQLEEQRRPAAAAHADDCDVVVRRAQHHHTKSLPSALQHVQVRGTLMDRLNMLESRIRQLSCELDLDPGSKAAAMGLGLGLVGTSSSSVAPPSRPPADDRAWSESAPMLEPCRDLPPPMMRASDKPAVADGSWSAVEILQRGARQLHRNKPNPSNKVKSLKEAKCACQKEKKKAEIKRTGRRWFGVGC
ncbi:hypothetical protein EJB05_56627 [Eragrostis curvula]|uniref:Uncharacterized protein n=1 Tax=Eragrostis curvula TaxID=38414 RepID=A0A5J9SIC5_9POAL|nr:hypothetical protein EJB05_56627 [Eragrostis curvula]